MDQQQHKPDSIALFLQQPYEVRYNAYRELGIIFSEPVTHLTWWSDNRNNRCYRIPVQLPEDMYYASKELWTDVQLMWWSENSFVLHHGEIIHLLDVGTPMMWSSLRHLDIHLIQTHHLLSWKEVCNNLKIYMRPNQLTLCFSIWIQNVTNTVRDALRSMLELPILNYLSLDIPPAHVLGVEIHHIATSIVKRHSTRHTRQFFERRSPVLSFPFMDLPGEIQVRILEYTDLVALSPVTASSLKGYILDDCRGGRCARQYICCEGHYNSSETCWSLPASLFHVNEHINMMSQDVFFSCNEFIVDVRLGTSYPAPRLESWQDKIFPGLWSPNNSRFLGTIPQQCIPKLRSLTWRFPMYDNDAVLIRIKRDWICTIDYIAKNVQPLSKLSLTLDMTRSQFPDEVMLSVRELHGLRGLFVRLPERLNSQVRAAEELRLERLAMGRDPGLKACQPEQSHPRRR